MTDLYTLGARFILLFYGKSGIRSDKCALHYLTKCKLLVLTSPDPVTFFTTSRTVPDSVIEPLPAQVQLATPQFCALISMSPEPTTLNCISLTCESIASRSPLPRTAKYALSALRKSKSRSPEPATLATAVLASTRLALKSPEPRTSKLMASHNRAKVSLTRTHNRYLKVVGIKLTIDVERARTFYIYVRKVGRIYI